MLKGGTDGIGKETVLALASRKATVIIASRNQNNGEKVVRDIRALTNNNNVLFMQLNLASLQSVRDFVSKFLDMQLPLNVLINNAGVIGTKAYQETEDGFEMQFGVNHLAHFLLTLLLLNKLSETPNGRIVNLSSSAHQFCSLNWKTNMPPTAKKYGATRYYGLSKLCNALFARHLQTVLQSSDSTYNGLSAYSLHPGVIQTNLFAQFPGSSVLATVAGFMFKTPEQGAATTLYCALHPEALSHAGGYFDNCSVSTPTSLVNDENAKKLWDISLQLVGLGNNKLSNN